MMQKFRSVLFAPGNKSELLKKLPKIQPDAAIVDLEDAVPDEEKNKARKNFQEFIDSEETKKLEAFPRVNPISSSHFELDIQALPPEVDCVVIPKINNLEELEEAEKILSQNSIERKIIVGIETVLGVASATEILSNTSVIAAYFGAEDYVLDLGGFRTTGNDEVFLARSQMGMASRLSGVPVIDQIVTDFSDDERFTEEAYQARALGFSGKLCIHPSQVPLANQSFSYSQAEVNRAKELLAVYDQALSQGSASAVYDGNMIDEALAKQARRILGS
ncbi:MAG: CoA ester lyase [Actinobacteria bacterium]|nr:CoA ester lyase [Actinomycetota bacterium]|tara:strand:+ start:1187 stop:2014 length:828 start_codon:yes stop_codon:yes gene_type:complete